MIPYLKAILLNANDKSNRMLRAKAMECISLVGMAVGKEKFRDDAKQVIFNLFLHIIFYFFFIQIIMFLTEIMFLNVISCNLIVHFLCANV